MNQATLQNRTFDEIRIGESAQLQRKLTEKDIELFAALSGDLNPTHMDPEFGGDSHPGEVVGHSMWAASLLSALLGNRLPGPGAVYRRQALAFERPVTLGDELTVTITVIRKQADGHTVEVECQALNQKHETVFTGTAEVIAPTERWVVNKPQIPEVTVTDHDGYSELIRMCAGLRAFVTAVVHPCDHASLRAAVQAAEAGLIDPLLVGPEVKIRQVAESAQLDISELEIVDVEHSHASAARAVELVRGGKAEVLMKGSLHTDELMAAVVPSATGLRTARRISHAFLMDVPTYPKPLIVTDAAINIAPDLDAKRDICQNAIDAAHALGIDTPRVAILSAVEIVTGKIPSTLDAAALCKMADRGQITGAIVDGPLAMDNAISVAAAETKGIVSPVAGRADILVAPDLESGNILAKQLTFLANADAAGIALGARVPIILTSRADDLRARMASCAVAVLLANSRRVAHRGPV